MSIPISRLSPATDPFARLVLDASGHTVADAISLDDDTDPMVRRLAEILINEQGLGFAAGVDAVVRVELTRDVRHIVAALAPELRSICALLQAHSTEQACRASGLSRATFYRRLHDIRLRFLLAGLAAARETVLEAGE